MEMRPRPIIPIADLAIAPLCQQRRNHLGKQPRHRQAGNSLRVHDAISSVPSSLYGSQNDEKRGQSRLLLQSEPACRNPCPLLLRRPSPSVQCSLRRVNCLLKTPNPALMPLPTRSWFLDESASASIAVVKDGQIAYLQDMVWPLALSTNGSHPANAVLHRIDQQAVHRGGRPFPGGGGTGLRG